MYVIYIYWVGNIVLLSDWCRTVGSPYLQHSSANVLTFLNQSESLYRNFTVHRCKFKKCYFCFKYKQKTQYGNIICENTQEKLYQCEKCNKKTFDPDCYRRHKNLSSYDCQIIKDCQSFYKE